MYEHLDLRQDGDVVWATMNRPERLNALGDELRARLAEAWTAFRDDPESEIAIFTGTGRAFCAGEDMKESLERGAAGLPALKAEDPFMAGKLDKPVIGAINGVAVTGGFELALNCDLLIASDRARFADTHCRIGVQPGWGLTVLLAEAVGVRRARQISITGNFLDAETARDWGLVNEVVPHEELLPRCRALAADIVSNDQAGVRRILRTYAENERLTGADAWRNETRVSDAWFAELATRPGEVEARRQAVMERGRRQAGGA